MFNNYSKILSKTKYRSIYSERLKVLTPIQMLQRLPITLAQVNAGNTSEDLLNEIRQIIYSFYWEKEVTKKAYNTMSSIKL